MVFSLLAGSFCYAVSMLGYTLMRHLGLDPVTASVGQTAVFVVSLYPLTRFSYPALSAVGALSASLMTLATLGLLGAAR